MGISDSNATKLTKMNRAAQNVTLGTLLQTMESGSAAQTVQITTLMSASQTANSQIVALQAGVMGKSGSQVITSTHTNASVVTIDTGVTIKGQIVQIYRSGSLTNAGAYVTKSSGSLSIRANTNGSYILTAGDEINWLAF
jgi:hypothetical protein